VQRSCRLGISFGLYTHPNADDREPIIKHTLKMQEGQNDTKDRAAALLGWFITLVAWMIVLALVYSVYLKFKILFH
jgi:hypothetical protein